MSVTNPIPLPAIAFSRNQLDLTVQSDDYLVAAAVKSVNFLDITGAIAADLLITLSWVQGSASMTAKDAPDDSGQQFPTGDGSDGYVTGLLDWFGANLFIDRDYVLTTVFGGANPRIVFTAIKNGPDYDFTNTNGGISGVTTGGVTDKPKANFSHHIQLWIRNDTGTAFQQAFAANVGLDYPVTGKTTIDISDELHAFLTSDKPELVDPWRLCPNSLRPYYCLFTQFYGDPGFVRKLNRSAVYYINKGGMSKRNALLRDMISELCPNSLIPASNRCLRQGSVNKLVSTEQPEWLYWINFTGDTVAAFLRVTIYYDDESSFNFTVGTVDVPGYSKVQFACGYAQLAIGTREEDKNVLYYTCSIGVEADVLSVDYAFVIDYQYRDWPRYFIYENSYGAFQTIGTVGKGLLEYDITKDQAQLAVSKNLAALDGDFIEVNNLLQEKATVPVGYDRSGKRNTALLRELMLSRENYLWDNGSLIPIGFNTKNLKDAADGVNVYANAIEYYIKYQEDTWTEPRPLIDDTIHDLLIKAGLPIPAVLDPPPPTEGGGGDAIPVLFDDMHLSIVDGHLTYTAAILIGKEGYVVTGTQIGGNSFRIPSEISYDRDAGSFSILIDGFELLEGENLVIYPFIPNPDL